MDDWVHVVKPADLIAVPSEKTTRCARVLLVTVTPSLCLPIFRTRLALIV